MIKDTYCLFLVVAVRSLLSQSSRGSRLAGLLINITPKNQAMQHTKKQHTKKYIMATKAVLKFSTRCYN
jgi:hypothetical protein